MARRRVPAKPGLFTVPDDPAEPPTLLASRCAACGEHYFPRRRVCARAACLSEELVDVEIGPYGTLFSFTFVHIPMFGSARVEHAGYGVGQIDLPEGPRVQFPLAGRQADYRVDMRLVAELDILREEHDADVVIVRFRPLGEGAPC